MKPSITLAIILCLLLCMTACGSEPSDRQDKMPLETSGAEYTGEAVKTEDAAGPESTAVNESTEITETEEEQEPMLQMTIDDTAVQVEWENNDSVKALRELCADQPLTIRLSMYGGFEQVGPIGEKLPRDDRQTTTEAGDIVLYSGDQMVVFYGSNSWAYTRLGKITDKTAAEMAELLGQGDVTVTVALGK